MEGGNRTADLLIAFQGITRLIRHVILEFIARQLKAANEPYDYRFKRHAVVRVTMAPKYWIGATKNLKISDGTMRLEGFLNQLSLLLHGVEKPYLINVRRVHNRFPSLFSAPTRAVRGGRTGVT